MSQQVIVLNSSAGTEHIWVLVLPELWVVYRWPRCSPLVSLSHHFLLRSPSPSWGRSVVVDSATGPTLDTERLRRARHANEVKAPIRGISRRQTLRNVDEMFCGTDGASRGFHFRSFINLNSALCAGGFVPMLSGHSAEQSGGENRQLVKTRYLCLSLFILLRLMFLYRRPKPRFC